MAAIIILFLFVLRIKVAVLQDVPPESPGDSFNGKEENLFDVDLIPMTGEENSDDGYRQNRGPSSYVPGSFDPTDVQADLIPMYDQNEDDPSDRSGSMEDYDQNQNQPPVVDQLPQRPPPESRPVRRMRRPQEPEMDFDVVVRHRLTDDGRVIFQPQIRRGQGGRRIDYPQTKPERAVILPIVTEPSRGIAEVITTPAPKTKIIIRKIVRRKPGDPGYGTGRVVKVVKRLRQ